MRHLKVVILCLFLIAAHRIVAQNPRPPCGTPGVPSTYVDMLNGVIAYSNDDGGPIGCYDPNAYEWECVEFIERYYSQRFNISLGSIPTAEQAFGILQTNSQFLAFAQGSTAIPQAEDLIVFGTNLNTPYGHVAIAKTNPILQSDGSYQIPIIEQNSYLTHVLVMQGNAIVGFEITGRLGLQNTAPIIGWVRSVTNIQTANEWTWVGGSNLANATGVYGTQGVPSVTNIPAGRAYSVGWVDSSSNFWLFGGGAPNVYYGDLWMLNPTAKTWTWVSGTNTINSQAVYGTKGVPATTNAPGSRSVGSLSWMDHNGNLWLFGGIVGWNASYYNDLWKFIPASGNWVWMSGSNNRDQAGVYGVQGFPNGANVPGARCCSVTWTDVSGNLWLFGGQGFDSKGVQGNLNDLWEFSTGTWTWVSGHNTTPSLNGEKGVYGTQGVPSVTNFPAGRDFAVSWIDNSGNLWLFGGRGVDSTGTYGLLNDLWEFTPGANTWTWVSGSQLANSVGVSGTKGIPSTTNSPGGRYGAVSWLDGSGNFWLFGGEDDALWNFNPTAKAWTWVSGTNLQRVHSVYGTLGVPSPTNDPGARFMPVAWPDTDGSLWLFGGVGFDSTGVTGYLNDLWRYQP